MGVTVNHRTFVIERVLPGRPAHAFRFFAEFALKRRWISCHPDWTVLEDAFDFRVGGGELTRWMMSDGAAQSLRIHYLEIHPVQRIIYAYTMETSGHPVSSSLVTIELEARGAGSAMTYTEQAVFGSAKDGDIREGGTGMGYDRLVEVMEAMPDSVPAHVP